MTAQSLSFSAAGALALAAALFAGACAIFWIAIPAPLLSKQAKIAEIRREIVTLEKQRARLGALDRWTTAREEALALRSDFLAAKSGASSSALVQGLVREAATKSGLTVISAQDYAPPGSGELAAGVRMSVSGDLNAITEFLMDLSNAKPRLFVETLVLRAQSGADEAREFSATVTVVAFYWSGEA